MCTRGSLWGPPTRNELGTRAPTKLSTLPLVDGQTGLRECNVRTRPALIKGRSQRLHWGEKITRETRTVGGKHKEKRSSSIKGLENRESHSTEENPGLGSDAALKGGTVESARLKEYLTKGCLHGST